MFLDKILSTGKEGDMQRPFYVLVVFMLGCQAGEAPVKINTSSQSSTEKNTPSNDKTQTRTGLNTPFDADKPVLSLSAPTEDQLIALDTYLESRRLWAAVNVQAEAFSVGYHSYREPLGPDKAELENQFLKALWTGDFDQINDLKLLFGQKLGLDPRDSYLLARMGFLNLWLFAERYRELAPGESFSEEKQKTLFDGLGAAQGYFEGAVASAPNNAVYQGFLADTLVLLGQGQDGARLVLRGLQWASESIQRAPAFNLFTIAYALTFLAANTNEFKLGLEMMFKNLDVCFDTLISRTNPDVAPLLMRFRNDGQKHFCLNSEIAPHNFEGFFMIFGDLLLKAGLEDAAKKTYNNAKLLPSFANWPYKDKLEERLQKIAQFKQPFSQGVDPMVKPNYPTISFNTEYACMVCHQK